MKKHKILIVAILAYIILAFISPDKILGSLNQSKYYFIEMLQILPAVFILTSLIQTWVPTKVIMKYFGDGSGIKGYGISFLIGSLSAGPIYAAFPVCQTLLKKGASIRNIVIILSTWAVVKVPMLINEAKFMGFEYMMIRWLLTLVSIFVMAYLINIFVKEKDIKMVENHGIDTGACILCGRCLKAYPDIIVFNNGKYQVIDNKAISKEMEEICPVGALKH